MPVVAAAAVVAAELTSAAVPAAVAVSLAVLLTVAVAVAVALAEAVSVSVAAVAVTNAVVQQQSDLSIASQAGTLCGHTWLVSSSAASW